MASRAAAKTTKEVYRGYMPIDLPQHRTPNRIKPWWKVLGKPRVTLYPKKEIEGFSKVPDYPPLNPDGSKLGLRKQFRNDWYDHLASLPTVEQKLYEINKLTEMGQYMAHINNWSPAYDSLPMIQYLTQTYLVDSLPQSYTKPMDVDTNQDLYDQVKSFILDQIALDKYESIKVKPRFVSKPSRDGNRNAHVSNRFIQNLISGLRKSLALEVNPQLLDYQYDLSPAIRSWWYHSGLKPPNNKIFYKNKKDEEGCINQMIQMDGSAALNIRSDSLIEPIVSLSDSLVTDTSLVKNDIYNLKQYGAVYKFKWPVALAGYWFKDGPTFDCPHTCILSTDCIRMRNSSRPHKVVKPLDDVENCLTGQAIMTAYGWLNSLSMYHGYTPFHELNYPFTCQTITTDGQNWLFNVYQLNGHSFHRDFGGASRNNLCWTSGTMQLYEEYCNGEFKGLNEDVFKMIIRFLAQKTSPEYMSELELRKYLQYGAEDDRTDEQKDQAKVSLRRTIEGRSNRWLAHDWKVPRWEHVFFRHKISRHKITHMKPRWHIPKPKYPRNFI